MTRPYAEVIGDPIAHSKSPMIHNFWLEKLKIDAEYRACHVRPEELEGYFASRRTDPLWRGCNVTIPHKEAVLPLLDHIELRARKIGAVNTVWKEDGRLLGRNTDVEGVAEAVDGHHLAGRHVVVIGAGGAARSAFAHLEDQACASVRVLARNPEKASAVVAEFSLPSSVHALEDAGDAIKDAALVVNATQLGMQGQPPMPPGVLQSLGAMSPDALVFDMVYAPQETELLKTAVLHGRRPSGGLTMLIGQAASAFEKFFGQPAPRGYDAELRKILTS